MIMKVLLNIIFQFFWCIKFLICRPKYMIIGIKLDYWLFVWWCIGWWHTSIMYFKGNIIIEIFLHYFNKFFIIQLHLQVHLLNYQPFNRFNVIIHLEKVHFILVISRMQFEYYPMMVLPTFMEYLFIKICSQIMSYLKMMFQLVTLLMVNHFHPINLIYQLI